MDATAQRVSNARYRYPVSRLLAGPPPRSCGLGPCGEHPSIWNNPTFARMILSASKVSTADALAALALQQPSSTFEFLVGGPLDDANHEQSHSEEHQPPDK